MNYLFYTGCSITSQDQELELSLKGVLKTLSVDLEEYEAPGCFGGLGAGEGARAAREVLSSRIIDACKGNETMVVPCAACYRELRFIAKEPDLGLPRILHPLELLSREVSPELLRSQRARNIKGLRVTPFYGCSFKSTGHEGVDEDTPHYMEEMFEHLGLETVWFPESNECCGGDHHMDCVDAWEVTSKRIVDSAVNWNVDIISVACPHCRSLLEGCIQSDKIIGEDKVVVMYYSQIAGYLMGLDKQALFAAGGSESINGSG